MSDFWQTVGLASAIATALATGVSTVATLWWRRQDRREADWAWSDASASWSAKDALQEARGPQASVIISNAGDGTAFRVLARGERCTVLLGRRVPMSASGISWLPTEIVPAMHPGDAASMLINCDPADWERATVLIVWTRSPTWRRKTRTLRTPLAEIAARPEPHDASADWTP